MAVRDWFRRSQTMVAPDFTGQQLEVEALESRKQELIAEVVEIGELNEIRRRQLAGRDVAENYMASSAAMDVTQWPTDHYGRPMVQGSSLSYRRAGAGPPVFRTEWDLTMIRELMRVVVATNETAIAVLENLTNYVVGEGNNISAKPTDGAPERLAEIAQEVLDEFFERNDWDEFSVESFQRSVRDGESFRVLYSVGSGFAGLRLAEPEQITQPAGPMQLGITRWLNTTLRNPLDESNQSMAWTFGVHADWDDAANVHGYFARWFPDQVDWDYLPGGNSPIMPPNAAAFYCQHIKRNSQANVKRGLSDFFNPRESLTGMKKLLNNYRDGAAIRAAIAYIRQMPTGVTKDAAQSLSTNKTEYSITRPTPGGNVSQSERRIVSGTTIDIPNGMNYLEAPAAKEDYEKVHDKCAEVVAGRWCSPGWFAGGPSDNVNYAAAFVAESPAVKYFGRQQKFYCNKDRRLLWKVLEIAWLDGKFGSVDFDVLKKAVVIQVEPSSLVVRDSLKETQRRQVLFDKGVMSSHTWALQEDLDPEVEQENRKRDRDQTPEESAAEQVGLQDEQAQKAKSAVESAAEFVREHWSGDYFA